MWQRRLRGRKQLLLHMRRRECKAVWESSHRQKILYPATSSGSVYKTWISFKPHTAHRKYLRKNKMAGHGDNKQEP